MRLEGDFLRLSATDLAKHLGCRHLTELDRAAAEGRLTPPIWEDPALELLAQRGFKHEERYAQHLHERGRAVVDLGDFNGDSAVGRTISAMRDGADVIVQAELRDGRWAGRADFLLKVEPGSGLGGWSYEVVDTKLAQTTRGGTILQLCLYSDLVGRIQGRPPERMHVVKPGDDFPRETYRCADFQAYYRLVRARLKDIVVSARPAPTYPDPVPQCDICRWWKACDQRRHDDDDLCLVAGIGRLHIRELQRQGIGTLEELGDARPPLRDRPERGSIEAFEKLREQARIQLRGRRENEPVHELLEPEDGRGLARLPEPSPGDVFFDIEGDRFCEGGGLEYLLGYAVEDERGALAYHGLWGLDRAGEKRAFEELVDFVVARWRQHPGMHVYHFAPYEPSAVKRLMGRHATREDDVDRLLRGGRFVDLHAVARQGLRASVERYSLKDLERFFGFERAVDLRAASAALRRVECAIELGETGEVTGQDRRTVEGYNEDDCLATAGLRAWLEGRRRELIDQGHDVPRPDPRSGDESEQVEQRRADVEQVYQQLVADLPDDDEALDRDQRARWLLAQLLDYYRREDKCVWWEFFRHHDLGPDELLDERECVTGLELVDRVGGTDACPVQRYRFPEQDVALRQNAELHEVGGDPIGSVHDVDLAARTLDIKKRGAAADVHPTSVFAHMKVPTHPLDTSLLELARSVARDGPDGPGRYRAARDLLLKNPPRLASGAGGGALRAPGEDLLECAVRLARDLDHGLLPIQGPPGSGKTFTGARMILALARAGKRVGVTAVSHKVTRNLLDKTLEAAREVGVPLEAAQKVTEPGAASPGLELVTTNDDALRALASGKIVGGTAWLWARDDAVEVLDYLFVDEAGQMSLANVLSVGRAAHNLVLLGDPAQLEQPQQGAHPDGTAMPALVHVLDGHETLPPEQGLFLDLTWRLHPDICEFTSELFYEGRLRSRPGLDRQVLRGATPFAGSGLFYVPVEHDGNQSSSPEETDAVAHIVESLADSNVEWTGASGDSRPLTRDDILIVTPYNAQVGALTARLPGARVGTVDKFQGQEAPVVIYSMTTSSPDDAPRGMSFLYDLNRLNVATSRARCACILVADPSLFEPDCRTPDQMRWANGLCRFRELARVVGVI